MLRKFSTVLFFLLPCAVWVGLSTTTAADPSGVGPLALVGHDYFHDRIADQAILLDDPATIEAFLVRVDGVPPDWQAVYGHHGSGHDERLFDLNRQRDARREGSPALQERVTFVWPGELSTYDEETRGFRVALGPKLIATAWGLIRFKPETLPANLIAVPQSEETEAMRAKVEKGERIEIDVAITGRLVPEESIIYDFAHDEAGRGMVMPVVLVEQVRYLMK